MKKYKQIIWRCFAVFDVFFVVSYLSSQLFSGRIPFYTDMLGFYEVLQSYDTFSQMGSLIALPICFVLLFISLCFSSTFLFQLAPKAKWLVLIQFPLRIILNVPSIPFIIPLIATSLHFPLIALILLVLIELCKVIYFFKIK